MQAGLVVSVAEGQLVVEAKSLLEAAQPLQAQLLDERPAHARSGRYLPEHCTGPSSSAGRGTPYPILDDELTKKNITLNDTRNMSVT